MDWSLFEPFGDGFCAKWKTIIEESPSNPTFRDMSGLADLAPVYNNIEGNDFAARADASPGMMLGENVDGTTGLGGGFDLSPPSMMSNMLESLSADMLYSCGNWFLQDF
jgi:hypothetical protein